MVLDLAGLGPVAGTGLADPVVALVLGARAPARGRLDARLGDGFDDLAVELFNAAFPLVDHDLSLLSATVALDLLPHIGSVL